jgi:hypothetical protein
MNSLRAELFGATRRTPEFALLLPPGWQRQPADADVLVDLLRAKLERLPDVNPSVLDSIEELRTLASAEAGQQRGVIGVLAPADASSDDFTPMTISLAWLESPAGVRITTLARDLVERRDAAPMDSQNAILRWVDREVEQIDGTRVHTVHPSYLIRVPGAVDRALLIRATILGGAESARLDEELISTMILLSDGIVATFRWRRDD